MPRRSSAALLSPPILIILLPTFIILFLIYTLPPILSFLSSHILQPTISVKKSWDSLNVFLVVFAILCGVFARKQTDEDAAATEASLPHHDTNANNISNPNPSSLSSSRSVLHVPAQQEWFGYDETTNAAPVIKTPENNVVDGGGGGRLRRRSSYPDMRQVESLWETLDDVSNNSSSHFRFFDDFEISNYKTHHHRHNYFGDDVIFRETKAQDDVIIKEIKVDTFVAKPSPSPPPAPPPPPPPPRRRYEAVAHRKKEKVEEVKPEEVTPAKSPAPVPAMRVRSDGSRLERRKSNVKREIAMVWNSVLSNQRKRKRKPKATRNMENESSAAAPAPPPPPPPPPSSVFQNLFKKGSKPKKTHSLVPTPPPEKVIPPAPPTPSPRNFPASISRRRPPLTTKPINKYYADNVMIINSGSQSPLIPIPPPPPPFKIPAMRFFVKGDYVKIRSRSASPELDDDQVEPDHEVKEKSTFPVNEMNGGDVTGKVSTSVFCPSPDVNTKADNFIARLRDEWRLEKINSLRSTS